MNNTSQNEMKTTKYQYSVQTVTLNDGFVVQPGKLTVLVGPNNSGKSRLLKEISAFTTRPQQTSGIVVSSVDVNYPKTLAELRDAYDVERHLDQNGNWMFRALAPDLSQEFQTSAGVWPSAYENPFTQSVDQLSPYFAEQFGRAMVAFLTTESRLQLVREGPSPSHFRQSSTLLQTLYNSGSGATRIVSTQVKKTFAKEVTLDFTVPQQLLLRVGDSFKDMPDDPRDARPLMEQYERLDDQGDGIRSFVGIIVALLTLKRGLFLIDEPEAFLHPPQAFRVGALIADQTDKSRQIILSTHSADVLRGILSRTRDVNIIRIDRVGNVNSFKHLEPTRLNEIVNDPLLTSARVLDGLFYSAAVVVEADSDARFYHAASLKRSPGLDLHFVNADNKQTVPKILRLYQDMGVRAGGVVDFDVLSDRAELEKSLQTLGFDETELLSLLEGQRDIALAVKELPAGERLAAVSEKLVTVSKSVDQVITRSFATTEDEQRAKDSLLRQLESRFRELAEMTKAWKPLKEAGRTALPPEAQAAFDRVWAACAEKGFFINPTGELESMMTEYSIPYSTDKKRWITLALPLVPNIEVDDVKNPWKFLKSVHEYLQTTLT